MEKEKKEIGKLLELLNEYNHFNSDLIYYGWDEEYERVYFHSELLEKEKEKLRKAGIYNEEDDGVDEDWIGDEWICSKKFGFIKWLVENNKIDCDKSIFTVDGDYGRDDIIYEIERQNYYILNEQYGVDSTDCILMLLSISSSPIEDLVSYLR